MMTPEEFRAAMVSAQSADIETAHSNMDDLMCKMLRELGYGDGADVYDHQEKWYA